MNLFRRHPRVSDRTAEIEAVARANKAARADAEAVRVRTSFLSARVHRIHDALMAEGQANHFTERWDRALRGKQ